MKKILTIFSVLLFPLFAHAATLTFVAPTSVGESKTFEITLIADTDTPLNTFAATIDLGSLTYIGESDGGSVINVWVTRPTEQGNKVSFAGLTAGGYVGRGGVIVRLLVRAALAPSVVKLTDVTLLRDDGKGTQEPVTSNPLTIHPGKTGGDFKPDSDTLPPEKFNGYVVTNDTSTYVAFVALDKNSGVGYYEVAERRLPWGSLLWHRAASPYLLTDQSLTDTIYIRATDQAGNTQTTVVPRSHILKPTETLLGCIVVLCVLAYFLLRRYFLRLR